ncbi:MAG: ATP-dependent helicase [Actinobacteria bacterium]|nr:ATP-dependent helicase [Actinomycetota bacterium]
MFGWLEDLNPAQEAAVLHEGGPLLVVAGAGTGKTKMLSCRVARLIADGTPPDRILLLTFSRRAAREMLTRAARMGPSKAAGRVWGGTFHAMAHRLLRRYGRHVGLGDGFTVIDQADTSDLLGLARLDLGFAERGRRFPKKETLASIYSRTVNAQEPLKQVLNRHFPWCSEDYDDIGKVFDAYLVRKRAQNVLDFDDLLLYWRVLATTSSVAGIIAERFDHVLVDEYQDTNALQADILVGLCAGSTSISAVGDDAQAIYSFRAAGTHSMAEFPQRFPGTTVVTLEQNYRSIPPVLDAANAVMAAAPEAFSKRLWSERPGSARPVLLTCADEATEANAICELVLQQREEGVALHDQAVLFRAGYHSDTLEIELSRRGVPFVKYGGLKFLEAAHVKDALSVMRMLENPGDELAWHRVLLLLDGVGPATARRLLDGLRDDVTAGGPLARLLHDPPAVPAQAAEDFERLRDAVAHCAGDPEPPPSVQLERITAFLVPIIERHYDAVAARVADLDQLRGLAGESVARAQFLADLTLDPPASTSDFADAPHLDDDYLILSTIHSAKGGEWKSVYVIHAADGCLPSDMALTDKDGLEEERRLFYVAITRAKDTLHVSYPQRFYHRRNVRDDSHSFALPSRFLSPAQLCFDERAIGFEDEPADCIDDVARAVVDPVGDVLAGLFHS